jgi:hypothetical protein
MKMPWIVRFGQEFDQEFQAIEEDTQDALLAAVNVLENYGPELGRPFVDTLKGSKYPILLVAGDKAGVSQNRFYKWLIAKADQRYGAHLERIRDILMKRGR